MNPSNRVAVATISTANYWPYTAVLIESLARACPDWDVHVLALNELPASVVPDNVRVLSAEDVWGAQAQACRSRFNMFEWACASKPRLLRFLLDNTEASVAVYADSDMEFFAPPDSVLRGTDSIILQPNVATVQECKSAAWERLHLQYGAYNGGFLAVRDTDSSRSFIDWWDERVTRYCCTEPSLDAFSDQRWLDMVPGLFQEVGIDRSPASNVAIWNVLGRSLRTVDGRHLVDGQPLSFFHYHRVRLGMDVEGYLTEVDHHPVVGELVRRYLSRAADHAASSEGAQQRHDLQADGTAIPPVAYRAVRDTIAEGAYSLAADRPGTSAGESLRVATFECQRLRARMRVLSYHWAHAKQVISPEAQIDRYERSLLYRTWIDLWFLANGSRHAQLPNNWTLRSPWKRRVRQLLGRMLRSLTSQ
jgi:hypothetical protein